MSRHRELADQFGTPLYVYDLDKVEAARRDLFTALPEEFDLFFALKANPHPEMARALREGGDRACRAEISSTGELTAALTAGFVAGEILYTGPGKTDGELREAIGKGVRHFSVESVTDMEHVGAAAREHGVVADCLLRINSETSSATTSIRMTGKPSQFGFDTETLAELAPRLTSVDGARVVGVHLFSLSNAKDETSLISELQHSITIAARIQDEVGVTFSLVDIGGGFAAPYATPGSRPVYEKLRQELGSTLDVHFPGWREGAPRVACESGRYLVGDSGTLLCGVVNIKESRGRTFVILDAGINTFGGMSGLGRLLPVAVQPDPDHVGDGPEHTERASLVGPLCTPGDILGREVKLPPLTAGDVIEIPNAGAYGPTASLLMFLGRPAPTEVLVRGDKVVSVSRIEPQRVYE
ncbi:diaminopimelate decarboxylase [Herbihabitans rhizosphaerae]|uniref:Diaminopimelate decarboxylase n=1 Tax=Herbihabitans rhizosphaerae TaxID=1872711 RepID=A0A4Q7KEN4_9PSEU|nr:type III PLP-dependent enzyme [Herbihabitans rhizosphaerae]RZS32714.1 diaminopimelate decarboxylase [Herbihabitans rhizosphaerae]